MIWKIIGSTAAILTMSAFIPQIFKALKTKSVKDVSIITLIQMLLGVSLWVVYGVYIGDAIVVGANIITILILLVMLFLYRRYQNKKYA